MNSKVLIVGGGIIGLSIARELRKKGTGRITIVERGKIGQEASFAAAGMLSPTTETDKLDDFYHFCSQSSQLYPAFAVELFDETGVDIELDRSGTLYLAFTETDSHKLRERFEWLRNAGLLVELLSAEDTLKAEPYISAKVRESLFCPNDWQVENRKLLAALRKFAELNGIEIREQTAIQTLLNDNGKILGAANAAEKFLADTTILATGAWTSLIELSEMPVPVKVKPIRGQMISYRPSKKLFRKVICSPRGYIVPRADGRILAGSTTEDVGFDKSITESGIEQLREAALEIAPGLANLEISDKWAGLRPLAADGLPILGEIAGVANLFLATAHYRNGILLAPITAKVVAEKIAEDEASDYLKIFAPQRF